MFEISHIEQNKMCYITYFITPYFTSLLIHHKLHYIFKTKNASQLLFKFILISKFILKLMPLIHKFILKSVPIIHKFILKLVPIIHKLILKLVPIIHKFILKLVPIIHKFILKLTLKLISINS